MKSARRRRRLKGIHSRSDTNRTGAEGLSFYYPRMAMKSAEKCFAFPCFAFDNVVTSAAEECVSASFSSLKYLHTAKCNSIVKFAYKLFYKALNPSTFERQNVKLVLEIFNNFTSEALALLGKELQIPHYENTSVFIKIITTWWSIVNVKTPWKGTRLRNLFETPLTADKNSKSRKYFEYFIKWLENWNARSDNTGKLTKETFSALHHVTNALLEISDYCLTKLKANYILFGKFQIDSLEARFGQYRQLAGGQYDVSLRQIYEWEKNSPAFYIKFTISRQRN